MRFALSAVAGTSGLVLLGLAFYGQPSLYLQQARDGWRQAREEWNRLVSDPAASQPVTDPPNDNDREVVAQRLAALQQQVARLRDELAARQALDAAAVSAPKPVPTPQPAPAEPPQAAEAPPASNKAVPSVALATQLPLQTMLPPAVVPPAAGTTDQRDAAKANWVGPSIVAAPAQPVVPIPKKRDAVTAEATPPKPEQPKPEVIKSEPVKPEPVKPEPVKSEAAKPELAKGETSKSAPQKVAVAKPPPPPPLPSPPRQDVDDTQSVLARLRQIGPTTVQPSEAPGATELKPAEPRPLPPPPSLPKLVSARAALAAGRIDDARRLLQEAQLQLVFRPVSAAGDEQPSAGRSSADVAHALEALSANNIPLSRRYIDIAADELSGTKTSMPAQVPDTRPTGYAPAYPPR